MGSELITVGYTIDRAKQVDVAAIVAAHREAIWAKIDRIDYNGLLDAYGVDDEGFEGEDDVLTNSLINGYEAGTDNYRHEAAFEIPGSSNTFVIVGGETWGDDPFEGFSDLMLLLSAVDEIPGFGTDLGILGSGIQL